MPSNTMSAWRPSSRRSLNVPGSPSSALQTTTRGVTGWRLQLSHFTPVVKPAPPRPSSRAALISSSVACGPVPLAWPRASAARIASPGRIGSFRMTSARRTLSSTTNSSGGHSSSGTRARIRSQSCAARAASTSGTGRPFTSTAGRVVAQADRRGAVEADEAVLRDLAGLDPQPLAHLAQPVRRAAHAVGDVVGEQHAVGARPLGIEERIERHHAPHAGDRHGEFGSDALERHGRQEAEWLLGVAQHLQQLRRFASPGPQRVLHGGVDAGRVGGLRVTKRPVGAAACGGRKGAAAPVAAAISENRFVFRRGEIAQRSFHDRDVCGRSLHRAACAAAANGSVRAPVPAIGAARHARTRDSPAASGCCAATGAAAAGIRAGICARRGRSR